MLKQDDWMMIQEEAHERRLIKDIPVERGVSAKTVRRDLPMRIVVTPPTSANPLDRLTKSATKVAFRVT